MTKKYGLLSSRLTICTIGIFFYILLAIEFFLSISQPYSNLGFAFDFYEPDFYITKVVKGTEAYNLGLEKGKNFYSINGLTLEEIINYRKSVSEDEYKENFSKFFTFGQQIEIVDYENKRYTFTLEKLPLKYSFLTTSFFVKFKFFVGMFMILCGLVIILLLHSDKNIIPLVYSLFFIGITTANLFDSEFSSYHNFIMENVLLDIGMFLTFTSIFQYFSEIFEYTHHKNLFKYIRFIPPAILIIKYIHILIFKWHVILNPFYHLNALIVVACCVIFLIIFFYVTITFPKNLTVTFKFFIIGLAFAITPLLIDHFCFILAGSIFMTEEDKTFSCIAFIFLPFMLLLAILHNKNLIRTKIVSLITSYFAFAIITAPVFLIFLDYLPLFNIELFSLFYVLISPVIIYLINKIITKFFSLYSEDNARKLANFVQVIAPITDTYTLHKVTTNEIIKLLDCSFVFYYKKNDENWDNLYTWGNITDENKIKKLNEAKTKNRVSFYNDGSFSIPILRNNKPTGVIYIGPKTNGDYYLPGEHILIEEMIRAFHNHYLMYTNNALLQELKNKNSKMIEIQNNTILSMANLIESRDGGTGAHVKRTAEYSVLIAKGAMEKGLFKDEITEEFINMLNKAAPMHDIGKIIVSDSVLKKPAKLTTEEFDEMKLHTTEGNRIVQEVLSNSEDEDYISMTSQIAMHHHEKWNGSGYPSGLKENQIPLCARILSIADVFDALVSPRCYKEPMDPDKAFAIIKEDAGKHFDPVLAEVFLELKDQALDIMKHEYL